MVKKKGTVQLTEDTLKKNLEATKVQSNGDITQKIADLTVEKETLQAKNKEQAEEIQELYQMLADKDKPEYLVVIPYKASEAQGNELYLAICGWLKHFKETLSYCYRGDKPKDLIMSSKEVLNQFIFRIPAKLKILHWILWQSFKK